MNTYRHNYSVNMFRVCVDSNDDIINGCVHSPMCVEAITFVGIGELLLKMDKLFDSIGYPQAFQSKRTFDGGNASGNSYRGIPKPVRLTDSILTMQGRLCTYDIAVESRRNTSWQGCIYDVDGMERKKFDGVVELLEALAELVKTE